MARAFARADRLDQAVLAGLRVLVKEVAAKGGSIWVLESAGPRRAWHTGRDGFSREDALRYARTRRRATGDPHLLPLGVTGQPIGVLALRFENPPSLKAREVMADSAGVLGPVLAQVARARQLEETVAAGSREIEAQRAFFERIVDTLPVGLYVIDREFRIRAWNSKRETGLQGVARQQVLGQTIFDVLHRQPADVLRREFEELFATGQIQEFQVESGTTGEPRVYRLSKLPMRIGSEITHAITIGEDITEWKQAEARIAQAEKLAALGTLAAGVMHEVNNPLATIAAAAETLDIRIREGTLSDEALRDELHSVLTLIGHEVHRCSGIVKGVLDFSRPAPTHRRQVAPNEIVNRTLFLLQHHSRFKTQRVITELGAGLPPVLGNDEQLIQVLMALLFNAMDATDGRGTVHVRTGLADEGQVMIKVADDGVGIRRADLRRIFEPFFTTKPVGRGTGLGLSVCYSIISDHGGRIEVESTHGQGSTFRVLLPTEGRR
ncbi:MAG TPA: ATP-binding protein [Gemmatimonadaceae bacterium]|nr:ATP-binding protein [Gemmatimonadaceae bacterium]